MNTTSILIVSIITIIVLIDICLYAAAPGSMRNQLRHKIPGGGIAAYILIKRAKSKADKAKAARIKAFEE